MDRLRHEQPIAGAPAAMRALCFLIRINGSFYTAGVSCAPHGPIECK
jgi:hypothetical protein